MRMFPPAMILQAEYVQLDRWDHGPIELVFLDINSDLNGPMAVCQEGLVIQWNVGARGGRTGEVAGAGAGAAAAAPEPERGRRAARRWVHRAARHAGLGGARRHPGPPRHPEIRRLLL